MAFQIICDLGLRNVALWQCVWMNIREQNTFLLQKVYNSILPAIMANVQEIHCTVAEKWRKSAQHRWHSNIKL